MFQDFNRRSIENRFKVDLRRGSNSLNSDSGLFKIINCLIKKVGSFPWHNSCEIKKVRQILSVLRNNAGPTLDFNFTNKTRRNKTMMIVKLGYQGSSCPSSLF